MDATLAEIETEAPTTRDVSVSREVFERECLQEWRPIVERYEEGAAPADPLRRAQCSYYMNDRTTAKAAAQSALLSGTLKKSERDEMQRMSEL